MKRVLTLGPYWSHVCHLQFRTHIVCHWKCGRCSSWDVGEVLKRHMWLDITFSSRFAWMCTAIRSLWGPSESFAVFKILDKKCSMCWFEISIPSCRKFRLGHLMMFDVYHIAVRIHLYLLCLLLHSGKVNFACYLYEPSPVFFAYAVLATCLEGIIPSRMNNKVRTWLSGPIMW